MKYVLNFIYFKRPFGEVCLTQECFDSGLYTRFLELWKLKHHKALAHLTLTLLVLEFTKHKHTLKISYTITVLCKKTGSSVRIGLLYSNIITVNCRNDSEITQHSSVSKNCK